MATKNTILISQLIDEAEHHGHCAIIRRDNACYRRAQQLTRRGELVNPLPTLYASSGHWKTLKQDARMLRILRSLAVLHPSWVFCGPSAALLLGLSVSYGDLSTVHVAVPPNGSAGSSATIKRHVINGLEHETASIWGIRVTSVERTLFDCARTLSFENALAIIDSGLRRYRIAKGRLLAFFISMPRSCRGRRAAIEVALHADAQSESGGESIARALMIDEGFALPKLQVWKDDAVEGQGGFRVDFCWDLPDGTIIGEMDGREKYANPVMTNGRDAIEVLADVRLRESHLTAGAHIVRFGWKDLRNRARFIKLLEAFGVPRFKVHTHKGFRTVFRYSERLLSNYSTTIIKVA